MARRGKTSQVISGVCPEVTVIVATSGADAHLAQCLDSLARQTVQPRAEIIVALNTPELLKKAFEQARGNIVALTDSHCHFPTDWLEKLRRAHDSAFAVIGGAVEHRGPNTPVAWATYFSDYGPFMLPALRQETPLLAGNHVSYKRSSIQESLDSMKDGYWKVFLHWDLERQGVRFLFDPRLVITRLQPETFWSFARRYFRDACEFAAMRAGRVSLAARLLHLVTTPALPPLLLYRRLKAVWEKKVQRARLMISIPLLVIFVTFWSAGELAGYARGSARSNAKP